MITDTFATAINCVDGRTQQPVIDWMKKHYGVDYVDMITEPGPDGIMARREVGLVKQIKNRVLISVEKHGSQAIALIAHGDCAGNPCSRDEHMGHLRRGMELIRSWGQPAEIVGLWVDEKSGAVEVIMVISKP